MRHHLLFCWYIPGKLKYNPNKTQQEEVAAKKLKGIEVNAALGTKTAAAVGRSHTQIDEWEAQDEQFHLEMSRAEYRFLDQHRHRAKLDNVFAYFFEERAPPTHMVDAEMTTIEGQSAADLLVEAKRLGLHTTPYESLRAEKRPPRN